MTLAVVILSLIAALANMVNLVLLIYWYRIKKEENAFPSAAIRQAVKEALNEPPEPYTIEINPDVFAKVNGKLVHRFNEYSPIEAIQKAVSSAIRGTAEEEKET